RIEVTRAREQIELQKTIAPQAVQVRGELRERPSVDGRASPQVNRAGGELLDERMMETQLNAPDVRSGVVIALEIEIHGVIGATPHTFPIIELIRGPGLFRLVANAQ